MIPVIDRVKTGEQIRKYMNKCGFSVQDVKTVLSLGCVQSVYHWLDGQSLPSLDNLYALSDMFGIPMDMLIVGTKSVKPRTERQIHFEHLHRYCQLLNRGIAA